MPDALAKQQEQAKAVALLQTFQQLAPMLLPLATTGAAKMINFDAVIEYFLKAHEIEDVQQFFIQPSKTPEGVELPGPGGGGGAPGEAPIGITGEGSIDPAVSPSAMITGPLGRWGECLSSRRRTSGPSSSTATY